MFVRDFLVYRLGMNGIEPRGKELMEVIIKFMTFTMRNERVLEDTPCRTIIQKALSTLV